MTIASPSRDSKSEDTFCKHGPVVWITGLSGAGKSTLGAMLAGQLRARGVTTVHLDGDSLREIVGDGLGHTPPERLTNAYRLSRLCRLLSEQGATVVCSTMSLFPEIWEWNRNNLTSYHEIYLKADRAALLKRDTKGIYRRAENGRESNVVGWDLELTEPASPHLVLENNGSSLHDLDRLTTRVLEHLDLLSGE